MWEGMVQTRDTALFVLFAPTDDEHQEAEPLPVADEPRASESEGKLESKLTVNRFVRLYKNLQPKTALLVWRESRGKPVSKFLSSWQHKASVVLERKSYRGEGGGGWVAR